MMVVTLQGKSGPPSWRAPLIAAALAAALGVGALSLVLNRDAQGPGLASATRVGGPFMLSDGQGKQVSDKDFLGHPFLVYFGFTFCPDACPTELQLLSAALDQVGDKAKDVKVLFITIDPERDTSSVISDYAKSFGPHVIGLTGTSEQIAQVARAYGVFYNKVALAEQPGDYTMDHTTLTYLMDKNGTLNTILVPNQTPDEVAALIAKLL